MAPSHHRQNLHFTHLRPSSPRPHPDFYSFSPPQFSAISFSPLSHLPFFIILCPLSRTATLFVGAGVISKTLTLIIDSVTIKISIAAAAYVLLVRR
jgi:hypothetical protein